MNGTRERVPTVRNSSELALVNILRLRESKVIHDVNYYNFLFLF